MGVPMIGCKCPVCLSPNEKNRRLRSSALLKINGLRFLIDVAPDVRQMVLKHKIDHLDGIFLTHYHEDHIGGLNDLRPYFFFQNGKPLSLILSENTLDVVGMRFSYLMNRFELDVLKELKGRGNLLGCEFNYFTYSQNAIPVNGFRFGDFAYITDIKDYSEDIFEEIKGVKVLVLSLLQERGTPMHFSFEEAMAFIEKSGVEKCYLMHISHEMEHEEMNQKLPSNVKMAYDGLEINL